MANDHSEESVGSNVGTGLVRVGETVRHPASPMARALTQRGNVRTHRRSPHEHRPDRTGNRTQHCCRFRRHTYRTLFNPSCFEMHRPCLKVLCTLRGDRYRDGGPEEVTGDDREIIFQSRNHDPGIIPGCQMSPAMSSSSISSPVQGPLVSPPSWRASASSEPARSWDGLASTR